MYNIILRSGLLASLFVTIYVHKFNYCSPFSHGVAEKLECADSVISEKKVSRMITVGLNRVSQSVSHNCAAY